MRLSINGEREMFSTKLAVNPEIWDSKSGRAIGKTAKIKELNGKLSDIQVLLKRHYYDLEQRHGYVTAEMVKNAYMGITAKAESLIPLYKEFLEDTKKMIGINRSDKTYQKYERCYRRVVEFMKEKYNISDIPLRELKQKFLATPQMMVFLQGFASDILGCLILRDIESSKQMFQLILDDIPE